MVKSIDSYRFLDYLTKKLVQNWIAREPSKPIPWMPLSQPLKECTVALISSGGIALKTDRPFDQEGERRNSWWGDPSYRILPRTATTDDIEIYHLHIDSSFAKQDMNCLLPLQRLHELEETGEIGHSALRHYSFIAWYFPSILLKK